MAVVVSFIYIILILLLPAKELSKHYMVKSSTTEEDNEKN